MQDTLSESLAKIKKFRIKKRRMIAILLVLSLIVSLDVFWTLRQPGLTLAGDADCGIIEHSHDPTCQSGETPCTLTEHVHELTCYSDETADVETQTDWKKMFADYPYTGSLPKDLVGIAKTQVGYAESTMNFELDENGDRHGYTRYGAWYGAPYSDWSATFVSFCLHYAKADATEFPQNIGANAMAEQWKKLGKFASADQYEPLSGDLVFFKDNTVGIVSDVQSATCAVIRGDLENKVQTSLIPYTDESISGWGIVNKRISIEELYDISNGPAVFIFVGGMSIERAQTYNLRRTLTIADETTNDQTVTDLITYLNKHHGSFSVTLLDLANRELPKDTNGNYIVHAGTHYKITLTTSSPDGFIPGTYQYQLPDGVEMEKGSKDFVVNDVTVGSWTVTEDGLVTLHFNTEANKLTDVTISATMGILFPADQDHMDFDGKITITIEKPREEIKVTTVNKWGEQGNPDNQNIPNKAGKLDPNKIYWTVQIEGNQNSNIPGSTISDRTLQHEWSYEHHYSESDIAAGLNFGVSVSEDESGERTVWHHWRVYTDDPSLTWTENGWEYTMPETTICESCGTPIQLGNDHYTYFVEYTSTPVHVDLAGELGYANMIEIDNVTQEGWGGFIQNEVKAAIYKHGNLLADASGAKIVWELQATIPKYNEGQKAEHDWVITDSMAIFNGNWSKIYSTGNDIRVGSVTANYFGTTINVPDFKEATENDPYAYYFNAWGNGTDNGASFTILQRCTCTEADCGEWAGKCNRWDYWLGNQHYVSDYCDCWRETEDTTFTFTYETDVTEEIELYGGSGSFAYNYADISNPNNYTKTEVTVPLPAIITKEDRQPDGTVVNYNITVNESKLNLTDGASLIIHDEMTDTLTLMRGSLVVKSEDADGNVVILQEDVDYTYTYDGTGNAVDSNGNPIHVLDIEILHPQPVMYNLNYNTMLIVQGATSALKYNNTATVYIWGGQVSDSSIERVFPDINFASNTFSVMIHKLSAENGEPLPGAKFGLFNAQGGLITTGTTNQDGKVYFQTDIINGIILREHKIYYVQELEPPPGYRLDDTIHEFTFCNTAGGNCDTFNELKEEHDLTRVPFDTIGHIDLTNEPLNYNLPATGGSGTYPIILASVVFIITPLVYRFIQRRKRERRGGG